MLAQSSLCGVNDNYYDLEFSTNYTRNTTLTIFEREKRSLPFRKNANFLNGIRRMEWKNNQILREFLVFYLHKFCIPPTVGFLYSSYKLCNI